MSGKILFKSTLVYNKMGRERIIISRVVERCKPGFGSLSIHEPVFFLYFISGFFSLPQVIFVCAI